MSKHTKIPLNRYNQPIPSGEDPKLFRYSGDSDCTAGALNFARLMDRLHITYKPIPRQAAKTPDFIIKVGDLDIAVEVSDIDVGTYDKHWENQLNSVENLGACEASPSTYDRLRKKLKDKADSFIQQPFSKMPTILALFNGCAFPYLNHPAVKDALYGLGHRVPISDERGHQISSQLIHDLSQRQNPSDKFMALFQDQRHRCYSAVACLDNAIDSQNRVSFMGAVSIRAYFNPLAEKALPPGLLRSQNEAASFWVDENYILKTDHEDEVMLALTTA